MGYNTFTFNIHIAKMFDTVCDQKDVYELAYVIHVVVLRIQKLLNLPYREINFGSLNLQIVNFVIKERYFPDYV